MGLHPPAGLTPGAATAGQRGRRVLLIEHADRPGKKILISGGGRCNFTNIGAGPDNFHSANSHFARSALARYTPADFLALVESHGIAWHEKTLGQLFCDGSARQIVALLLTECDKGGVELRLLGQQPDRGAGRQLGAPGGRLVEAGHDPQQRRLAGAVRAEDADLRPGQERERDARQHLPLRAVELVDPVHGVDVIGGHEGYSVARVLH